MNASTVSYGCAATPVMPSTWWRLAVIRSGNYLKFLLRMR